MTDRIAAHDSLDHPPEVRVSADGRPTRVTMLVDPRGQVHAICGILPTKRLRLEPAVVSAALARMEITLRAGPILTRAGHVDHLTVADPDLAWWWMDDENDTYATNVEPIDGHEPLPAGLELRSGFLVIKPLNPAP